MQDTKIINTHIKADPIIYKRWSSRKFLKKDLKKDELMVLFEAARWAASSYNEQPWFFVYGTRGNPSVYDRLLNCLNDFNKKWAQQAPVLMLTGVKTFFNETKKKNAHAFHDLGLAMGNFTYQASKLNIMIHHMAGFDQSLAKDIFNIPEGYEPATMVAIGYADEEKPDRKRNPIHSFVFEGKFEHTEYLSSQ